MLDLPKTEESPMLSDECSADLHALLQQQEAFATKYGAQIYSLLAVGSRDAIAADQWPEDTSLLPVCQFSSLVMPGFTAAPILRQWVQYGEQEHSTVLQQLHEATPNIRAYYMLSCTQALLLQIAPLLLRLLTCPLQQAQLCVDQMLQQLAFVDHLRYGAKDESSDMWKRIYENTSWVGTEGGALLRRLLTGLLVERLRSACAGRTTEDIDVQIAVTVGDVRMAYRDREYAARLMHQPVSAINFAQLHYEFERIVPATTPDTMRFIQVDATGIGRRGSDEDATETFGEETPYDSE